MQTPQMIYYTAMDHTQVACSCLGHIEQFDLTPFFSLKWDSVRESILSITAYYPLEEGDKRNLGSLFAQFGWSHDLDIPWQHAIAALKHQRPCTLLTSLVDIITGDGKAASLLRHLNHYLDHVGRIPIPRTLQELNILYVVNIYQTGLGFTLNTRDQERLIPYEAQDRTSLWGGLFERITGSAATDSKGVLASVKAAFDWLRNTLQHLGETVVGIIDYIAEKFRQLIAGAFAAVCDLPKYGMKLLKAMKLVGCLAFGAALMWLGMITIGALYNIIKIFVPSVSNVNNIYVPNTETTKYTAQDVRVTPWTLLVSSLIAAVGLTQTQERTFVNMMRNTLLSFGVGAIVTASFDTLLSLLPATFRNASILKLGTEEQKTNLKLEPWTRRATGIISLKQTPAFVAHEHFASVVNQLVEESLELRKLTMSPGVRGVFVKQLSDLFAIQQVTACIGCTDYQRKTPFSIHISGKGGIGKSTMCRQFITEVTGHESKTHYFYAPNGNFWPAWHPIKHKVLVWDEFLMTADSQVRARQTDEYVGLVSSQDFSPEFASLDNMTVGMKGTRVHPDTVLTISNMTHPVHSHMDDDVIFRRRNIVWSVFVDSKYVKAAMDKAGVVGKMNSCLDLKIFSREEIKNFSWLKFKMIDSLDPSKSNGAPMTYREAVTTSRMLWEEFRVTGDLIAEAQGLRENNPVTMVEKTIKDIAGSIFEVPNDMPTKEVIERMVDSMDDNIKEARQLLHDSPTANPVGMIANLFGGPLVAMGKRMRDKRAASKTDLNKEKVPGPPEAEPNPLFEPKVKAVSEDLACDESDVSDFRSTYSTTLSVTDADKKLFSDQSVWWAVADQVQRRTDENAKEVVEDWEERNRRVIVTDEEWLFQDDCLYLRGVEIASLESILQSQSLSTLLSSVDTYHSTQEDKYPTWWTTGKLAVMGISAALILKVVISHIKSMTGHAERVEPFQAQSHRNRKREVRKVDREFVAHGETLDLTKCHVTIFFGTKTLHGIPLGGKRILVHAHSLFDPSAGYVCKDVENVTVEYKDKVYTGELCAEDVTLLRLPDSDERVDLCVIDLYNIDKLDDFRNITQHFIDRTELEGVMNLKVSVPTSTNIRGVAISLGETKYKDDGGFFYTIEEGWLMRGGFTVGDCGLPWVGRTGAGRPRIIGIHVAGEDGVEGVAMLITKKMAENALKLGPRAPPRDRELVLTAQNGKIAVGAMPEFEDLESYYNDILKHRAALLLIWTAFPNIHDIKGCRLDDVLHHDTSKISKMHGVGNRNLEEEAYLVQFVPSLGRDPLELLEDIEKALEYGESNWPDLNLVLERSQKGEDKLISAIQNEMQSEAEPSKRVFNVGCLLHYAANRHHPMTWQESEHPLAGYYGGGATEGEIYHRILDMMAAVWRAKFDYNPVNCIALLGSIVKGGFVKQGGERVRSILVRQIEQMKCMQGSTVKLNIEAWPELAYRLPGLPNVDGKAVSAGDMTNFLPRKTNMKPSSIRKIVTRAFPNAEQKQPSVLEARDPRNLSGQDPLTLAMLQLATANPPPLEPRMEAELLHAKEGLTKNLMANLNWPICRFLTIEEAIIGIPGVLKGLNLDTALGFPLCNSIKGKGKHGAIKISPDRKNVTLHPDLIERIFEVADMLTEDGDAVEVVWQAFLKDELRTEKKIKAGNTRVIYSGDVALNIVGRMLFGDLLAALQGGNRETNLAIGYNQASFDMDEIYQHLQKVDPVGFIAGDMKNFDKNTHPAIRAAAYDILGEIWQRKRTETIASNAILGLLRSNKVEFRIDVSEFNGEPHGQTYDTDLSGCWQKFVAAENHALIVAGDTKVKIENAHLSGLLLTTPINCLQHEIMWRSYFKRVAPDLDFDKMVSAKFLGDDHINGVNDIVREIFTATGFAEYVRKFGQLYTSDDKEVALTDELRPFDQITFLGCHPRKIEVDGHERYTGAMRKITLENTLRYTRTNDTTTLDETNIVLDFASQWDLDYYNKWSETAKRIYQFHDVKYVPTSYTERRARVAKTTTNSGGSFPNLSCQSSMKEEIVTVTEAMEMIKSMDGGSSGSFGENLGGSFDVAKCLSAPVQVNSFTWSSTNAVDTSLMTYELPFGDGKLDSIQKKALSLGAYWKGDVLVITQVLGTPYHQGSLTSYFRPLTLTAGKQEMEVAQAPSVRANLILPSTNHTSVHHIKYCCDFARIPTSATGNIYGSVNWKVRSLLYTEVTPASVSVRVYVALPNSKLYLPSSVRPSPFVRDYGTIGLSTQGPMVSKLLPKTMEVEGFGVKGTISMDRFAETGSIPVYSRFPSAAQVDVPVLSSILGKGVEDVLPPLPGDMSTVEEWGRIPAIVGAFQVTESSEKVLFDRPLSIPMVVGDDTATMIGGPIHTPGMWLVDKFRYWRGDICIRVNAFKTQYHSFRLRAVVKYGVTIKPTDIAVQGAMAQTLDFSGENCSQTIRIDFEAVEGWLTTNHRTGTGHNSCMGWFAIEAMDKIIYGSTVSGKVNLDVEMWIENLQVKCPIGIGHITSQSGTGTIALTSTPIAAFASFLAYEHFKIVKGGMILKPGAKAFPDLLVGLVDAKGKVVATPVRLVPTNAKVFPLFKTQGEVTMEDCADPGETTEVIPIVGETTVSESMQAYTNIYQMARRFRRMKLKNVEKKADTNLQTFKALINDNPVHVSTLPVAPMFGFEDCYGSWSGSINYRIKIDTPESPRASVFFVPSLVHDDTSYPGRMTAVYGEVDHQYNMESGDAPKTSVKITPQSEAGYSVAPGAVPVEWTNDSDKTSGFFTIPFVCARNFLPTGHGIGNLVITCSSMTGMSIDTGAGDDFRYGHWRGFSKLRGPNFSVTTIAGGNIVWGDSFLKLKDTAPASLMQVLFGRAVPPAESKPVILEDVDEDTDEAGESVSETFSRPALESS